MNKIKAYWNTLSDTVVTTKKEHWLLILSAALCGCVIGMLLSPKKIIYCECGDDRDEE